MILKLIQSAGPVLKYGSFAPNRPYKHIGIATRSDSVHPPYPGEVMYR
jgi:hypothetical protein